MNTKARPLQIQPCGGRNRQQKGNTTYMVLFVCIFYDYRGQQFVANTGLLKAMSIGFRVNFALRLTLLL